MKWLIGIFALAATIAGIAITLPPTVEALSPDEALLRIFPKDSTGVMFLDLAELRDNPLVREYFLDRADIQLLGAVAEFARRTGIDPKTDVDQVMLGQTGAHEFLGVARANYDSIVIEQYFRDSDAGSETYSGRVIYRQSLVADWSLSFVEGLVLIGDDGSVRRAIDQWGTTSQSAMDSPELTAAIESIEEGNQVWGVGTLTEMRLPEAMAPPMAVNLIASLERVTYQLRLDEGLTVSAVGEFAGPDTARRTGDLLRGVVALGKMQVMESDDLIQLFDGLQVDSVESSVKIRFSADGELLRRVTELGFRMPRPAD